MARTYFEKLRKRYNKKKNDLRKVKKSGSSTQESQKAEKALEPYKFLSWLDNFIYIRESRSNVGSFENHEEIEDEADELDEDEDVLDGDFDADDNEFDEDILSSTSKSPSIISPNQTSSRPNSEASSVTSFNFAKQKPSQKRKAASSRSVGKEKKAKDDYINEMEMNIIRDLSKTVKSNELDGIDLYVRSLAVDLKKISDRDFLCVKHEIQNIVFKYQMGQFGMTNQQLVNSTYNNVSETGFTIPDHLRRPYRNPINDDPSEARINTRLPRTTHSGSSTNKPSETSSFLHMLNEIP